DCACAPSTAPGKSKHRERPLAIRPGLRLRSVHGSTKIKTSGTSFGTSSGTADCVLRPRLREKRNIGNVLRRFFRDCGLRPPSTAPGKSKHRERPPAIRPGLRTASSVHGSGEIETRGN
ncbi:MAG: hypothetical protein Q4C96_10800, partial [Planctomycetia bacterium]|nr:hypothetical protein [Planctomycetia bacterium]